MLCTIPTESRRSQAIDRISLLPTLSVLPPINEQWISFLGVDPGWRAAAGLFRRYPRRSRLVASIRRHFLLRHRHRSDRSRVAPLLVIKYASNRIEYVIRLDE